MSDDRLFVMNNAIGRRGYTTNLILLAFITFITNFIIINFVLPYTQTDEYLIILSNVRYIVLFGFFLLFISLVDRRLFDICGSRNTTPYKMTIDILWLVFLLQVITMYFHLEQNHLTEINALLKFSTIIGDIFIGTISLVVTLLPTGKRKYDL